MEMETIELQHSLQHRFLAIISSTQLMIIAIAAFVFSACFLFLSGFLRNNPRGNKLIPPGSFGLPFIGETLHFIRGRTSNQPTTFIDQRVAKYGQIFKTSFLHSPVIVLTGALANKFIFSSEHKLRLRNAFPKSILKMLGDSAPIAKSGPEHKRLRQLMGSCLYPEALRLMVDKVDDITRRHFVEHWQGKQTVKLYSLAKLYAFTFASSVFVGLEDEVLRAKLQEEFRQFAVGIMRIPIAIPGTQYHRAKVARATLGREFSRIIQQRRQEIISNRTKPHENKDFVTIMLKAKDENGSSLTNNEMEDVLLFLILAGHDSTATTLTFLCKYLAENPEHYDCVAKEQREIAAQKKAGEKLSWEDILSMKHTGRAMQETLRLKPPSQGGFREALEDLNFGGYSIPKGWKIHNSIAYTHLDEKYFPEPYKFDPSRFEHGAPAPFTYIPFGGGPHVCPGGDFARMIISVYMHHLINSFKWSTVDYHEPITIDPMPRPVHSYPINVQPLPLA